MPDLRTLLSFRRLSAVYIFVLLFAIFGLTQPDTFLTTGTWRSLLDTQALVAMLAIGLTIPVAAGVFDLAIGAQVGLTTIFISWLLVNQGTDPMAAIPLTLGLGALVGLTSGILVAVVKLDSFIATLGMSSVAGACTMWLSGGSQVLGLPSGFVSFATNRFLGLTYPVWMMLLVAVVVWYVLEMTPVGRQIYATGGNEPSARLAGVNTTVIQILSLMACGVIAAFVGLLLASRLGTGDPSVGPSYLLPAFCAVFLGSTQFKAGRFNVWGTVVAVYVLAVGVTGLQLSGAPVWIPDLFNGLALLIAVSMAKLGHAHNTLGGIRRLVNRVPFVAGRTGA